MSRIAFKAILIALSMLTITPFAESGSVWTQSAFQDFNRGVAANLSLNATAPASMELLSADYGSWTRLPPPMMRYEHAMATTSSSNTVVLFSGRSEWNGPFMRDTWTYNFSEALWTHREYARNLNDRAETAMASIGGTDRVLLFGGFAEGGIANDTWTFNVETNDWERRKPPVSPPIRYEHTMAAVYNTDKVVLFGGQDYTKLLYDTWIYDYSDDTWTNPDPPTDPPLRISSMASVTGDDKVMLFGRVGYSAQTWIYDLGDNTWTNRTSGTQPPQTGQLENSMAAFSTTDRILLLPDLTAETWVYDVSDNLWTNKSATQGPGARMASAMAPVLNDDKVLLFGGALWPVGGLSCDTWIYDLSSSGWRPDHPYAQPPGRAGSAMATIPGSDQVVLFGGSGRTDFKTDLDDTWLYDPDTLLWTRSLSPARPGARHNSSMAAISGQDKVVLFGGQPLNDETWVYDASLDQWSRKNPTARPSARYGHRMAGIYNEDKVVLFGGRDTGGLSNETWVYDFGEDSWTNLSPASAPSARWNHAMAMVDGTDQLVLFGGNDTAIDGETWIYDLWDNAWSRKIVPAGPGPVEGPAMATLYGDDKVVMVGGDNGYGGTDSHVVVFDLSSCTWTFKNEGSYGRKWHSLAAFSGTDRALLFGGCYDYWDGDLKVLRFRPDTWRFALSAYYSSGSFITSAYDTGGRSDFRSIWWNASVPKGTGLSVRIRTADNMAGLNTTPFLGPDGSDASAYTIPGQNISSCHSGARWVQYRADFTSSDIRRTPRLYDISVAYDRLPAPPVMISPADGAWLNQSRPEFCWEFSDVDSPGQAAYRLEIDDDPNFTSPKYNASRDSDSGRCIPETQLADGIYYWRVRTQDCDGGWGQFNGSRAVKIDTVPPEPFTPVATPQNWTNQTPAVTFHATDALSGIGWYEVSIGGGCFSRRESPCMLLDVPDGESLVIIRAYDNASNPREASVLVKVDRIPPAEFSPNFPFGEWTNDSRPEVEFYTTDGASGLSRYEVKIDDGQFSDQSSPFRLPELADGCHTVTVRAFDRAGNIRQSSRNLSVDTVPPAVGLKINGGASRTTVREVQLEIAAYDPGSGLALMSFSEDGRNETAREPFASKKDWTLTGAPGARTVQANVRDMAGNVQWAIARIVYDPVTCITLAPHYSKVRTNGTVQLLVEGLDNDGNAVAGVAFCWSLDGDAGTIGPDGLFRAAKTGGSCTVRASWGGKQATARVDVNYPPTVGAVKLESRIAAKGKVTIRTAGVVDGDGDRLQYLFDFGDGSDSGWQNGSSSAHAYNATGKYQVRFKVRDTMGEESAWSPAAGLEIVDRPEGGLAISTIAILVIIVIILGIGCIAGFVMWRRKQRGA